MVRATRVSIALAVFLVLGGLSASAARRQAPVVWSAEPVPGLGGATLALAPDRLISIGELREDHPRGTDVSIAAYDPRTATLRWWTLYDERLPENASLETNFRSVAADDARLYVGATWTPVGKWMVRAHDLSDGARLWEDVQAYGDDGWGTPSTIAVGSDVVAVAGTWRTPELESTDWVVRAYEAATGEVLWERFVEFAGGFDQARVSAIVGERLFVAGEVRNEEGRDELHVRAYRLSDGELLWTHAGTLGSWTVKALDASELGVAIAADRLRPKGREELVQALDPATGELLWRRAVEGANALAVDGTRLVVAGSDGVVEVRSLRLATGRERWSVEVTRMPDPDSPVALAVDGKKVHVAGTEERPNGQRRVVIAALLASNGEMRWRDANPGGVLGRVVSVVAGQRRVFLGGEITRFGVSFGPQSLLRSFRSPSSR